MAPKGHLSHVGTWMFSRTQGGPTWHSELLTGPGEVAGRHISDSQVREQTSCYLGPSLAPTSATVSKCTKRGYICKERSCAYFCVITVLCAIIPATSTNTMYWHMLALDAKQYKELTCSVVRITQKMIAGTQVPKCPKGLLPGHECDHPQQLLPRHEILKSLHPP